MKAYKSYEKQKRMIPKMIRSYCHHAHKTKGKELCQECQELTTYALARLEHCPFKKDKIFCSTCAIHCYRPKEREAIKNVMRYSGPRLIFTHPLYALSHLFATLKAKQKATRKADS